MFGQVNQRSAMRSKASGVHRLMMTMMTSTASNSYCAQRRAFTGELAFGLHDQPGRAEQRVADDERQPVNSGNGASQSNVPPAN